MSLSGWLRDYVYIPLGGNRKGLVRKYINIVIVFVISGLWHGVGIHYLVWGMLHGLYQVIGALTKPIKERLIAKCSIKEMCFRIVWSTTHHFFSRGVCMDVFSSRWNHSGILYDPIHGHGFQSVDSH